MYILGLSCFYHDSAAVLLRDGEIVFAAQEERYTRKKHDEAFPKSAIAHALEHAGITANDLNAVAFYEKPMLKFFDRILQTTMKVWPRGLRQYHLAMHEWMPKKLWTPQIIQKELGYKGKIFYPAHHESHAASAFFCSGFPDAAVITADGVGEWATTTIGHGQGKDLKLLKEIRYPHSLGLLYSAITYYLGFKVNSAEYKVMGLAPYGEPKYVEQMRQLIDLKPDGSFALAMQYFTYEYGLRMTGKSIETLFGKPTRDPESPLEQFHKDIARSLQEITDEAMLNLARAAKQLTGSKYLCLAGGVALNCVSNGKILRSGIFEDIFIQPASGDAGGALGAALMVWHKQMQGERLPRMQHTYLGNAYSQEEIEQFLKDQGMPYDTVALHDLPQYVAKLLEGENVLGWFQGRMEFGPRSLGNRSIIADARNPENWKKVNLKIKFRESFRPFAPTILEERTKEYFALDRESPYMLLVADTLPDKRREIPAVTHVDSSARIQTINRNQNALYYDLLKAFEASTGCPVIINTSFNVRGEPIVESPKDALNCFLHTHMDYLVLGQCVIDKKKLPPEWKRSSEEYLKQFALD
ncbi:carbamoyltransferase [Candidatus Peribacteria bacterium]|nr:carbamoyltransferase [Candidatus Peribacteria bacterium]